LCDFASELQLHHSSVFIPSCLDPLSARTFILFIFQSFATMSTHSSTGAQKTDDVVGDGESGSIADTDALQLVIFSSTTEGNDLAGNDAFGITELIGNVDL
jgi:hypothetical protein